MTPDRIEPDTEETENEDLIWHYTQAGGLLGI